MKNEGSYKYNEEENNACECPSQRQVLSDRMYIRISVEIHFET